MQKCLKFRMYIQFNIFCQIFFWLNFYWSFCKLAGLWACNQLSPKYVKESKSAFQILLSVTNKPKENETWRLNFPIDIFLKRKRHSVLSLSPTIYIVIIIFFTVEMWLWVHFRQREASGVSGRGWVTSWSGWRRWWLGHKMMIIIKVVMIVIFVMMILKGSHPTWSAEKAEISFL